MTDYNKLNHEAREAAEAARERRDELVNESLRYARQCKGEEVSDEVRVLASLTGKLAAEARKEAKEKEAAAASARRIACFKATPPAPPPPELPKPLAPPGQKPKVQSYDLDRFGGE